MGMDARGIVVAVRRGAPLLVGLAVLVLAGWTAPTARAVDSIYWVAPGNTFRLAGLNGSPAPTNLFTGVSAQGFALDPAANRIYWANSGAGTIRVAGLDGSPAPVDLFTAESNPISVAVDPAADRIYWTNGAAIRVAGLDGSPAPADLYSGEGNAFGIAIDPASDRIYWSTFTSHTIRVAGLDGSPAPADLFTGESRPGALAIDPAANRIYWTDNSTGAIRVAGLDGSPAPADLYTSETLPVGVAIDPGADRIYWVNNDGATGAVRFAGLGGSPAPANLFSGQGTSRYPVLLKAPVPAGAPTISGGGRVGQALSCTPASWAGDLPGAHLYRAPRSFAFQWLLDGIEIAGATGISHTPDAAGSYACRVTATNQAGSASQTSASVNVSAQPVDPTEPVTPPDITPPSTTATDTTPPETTLSGPRKKVEQGKKAKFRFESTELGSSFQCRVDKKPFKPCTSPKKVKTAKLDPGKHKFFAFATDAAGNADQSAARVRFKVFEGP